MLAKTTINACKFTQLQRVNPDYTAPGCPADGWMLGVDNNRSLNINNNYASELRLIFARRGSLAARAGWVAALWSGSDNPPLLESRDVGFHAVLIMVVL